MSNPSLKRGCVGTTCHHLVQHFGCAVYILICKELENSPAWVMEDHQTNCYWGWCGLHSSPFICISCCCYLRGALCEALMGLLDVSCTSILFHWSLGPTCFPGTLFVKNIKMKPLRLSSSSTAFRFCLCWTGKKNYGSWMDLIKCCSVLEWQSFGRVTLVTSFISSRKGKLSCIKTHNRGNARLTISSRQISLGSGRSCVMSRGELVNSDCCWR